MPLSWPHEWPGRNTILPFARSWKVSNVVMERTFYYRLISLGEDNKISTADAFIVEDLLSFSGGEIRAIVRDILASTPDSDSILLLKAAEECYKHATGFRGRLDSSMFNPQRARGRLASSPYGPPGHNHEALALRSEAEAKELSSAYRRCWTNFWIQVVNHAPGGPTLFHPPASLVFAPPLDLDPGDPPVYLFRTFDWNSPGVSNSKIVASALGAFGSPQESRTDLLALGRRKATALLHRHLDNPSFEPDADDNLMSWTSSPLFAIQEFLPGQFAPESWLLELYRATAMELGGPLSSFWRLRDREEYCNGEYLSQGTLTHAGRSCLVTLEHLERAGLYELYPEFCAPESRNQWTNRVKELRQGYWAHLTTTTDKEIQLALQVGRCFSPSDPLNMALMLLSFKNRDNLGVPRISQLRPPRWAEKPVEVCRFWRATQVLKACKSARQDDSGVSVPMGDDLSSHYETLRGIFREPKMRTR
ncbi:uncharacterized protein PG986_014267 [Apiospora aurea]|uniref:Uncharacterized protein n=1 Tax=Apiospora aurea TaxID=335848 RepID=A0ABR1PSH5_9PEZI